MQRNIKLKREPCAVKECEQYRKNAEYFSDTIGCNA